MLISQLIRSIVTNKFNPLNSIGNLSLNRAYHILAGGATSINQIRPINIICPTLATKSPAAISQQCSGSGGGILTSVISIPTIMQTCGFKYKRALRLRCKSCYYVVRQGQLNVICKTHPRHKQKAIMQKEKSTWILTHATQSKVRPY